MKSIETRILRGPNQWSDEQHFLIVLKIDLEHSPANRGKKKVEEKVQHTDESSSMIEQFMLFIKQLQDAVVNVSMRAWYQCIAGSDDFFVIVPYENEPVGLQICRSALVLMNEWLAGKPIQMEEEIKFIRKVRKRNSIGATSNYILQEVNRRRIPVYRYDFGSLMILGYGCRQKKIRTAVTDETSGLGIEVAGDKEETKFLLQAANCPIPRGIVVSSEEELKERLNELNFPVVIKPLDGNQGRGVTTNISNEESALLAFRHAVRISDVVIAEEFIEGVDYRFLLVDFKLVAVARRLPAQITGNGVDSIKDLIERENLHKDRGGDSEHVLAKITIDASTEKILRKNNLTLSSVLPYGFILVLKDTANISAGGTAEDATEEVHPFNRLLSERIARLFNLNICGVDIVAKDIAKPLREGNGAVIEVNAGPGLRMHSNPQKGQSRDIASPIVDLLFKNRTEALIPIVAVTGTNGKTTTTRLIAHLAEQAGRKTGYCCSDGIYSNGWKLREGDCSGASSARMVLHDPLVDFAILETARGGIIRNGLAFESCDVAVVTNVTEDHLDLRDIHTVEELAEIKAVVVKSVHENGFAVLNAEDHLVYAMKKHVPGRGAFFSLAWDNANLQAHLDTGGIAAFIKNDRLFLSKESVSDLGSISDFPLSFKGTATFMIQNILAASLAAFCSGITPDEIRQGLLSFEPGEQSTPGRMNHYSVRAADLYLDYAHNVDGFRCVSEFVAKQSARRKLAVIAVAGDRRETDIREMGRMVASVFDEVIIRYNKKERGLGNKKVCELLEEGCRLANGHKSVLLVPNEEEALNLAVKRAKAGDLIFACADHVKASIAIVQKLKSLYGS